MAKCRLFHGFSTVTAEVHVSDWHPTAHRTGSVNREELNTFDLHRGQRKRCVLSGTLSAMSLTSKQGHTDRVCFCLKEETLSI